MSELSVIRLWSQYQPLVTRELGIVNKTMAGQLSTSISSIIRRDWPHSQQLMHFTLRVRELYAELLGQITSPEPAAIPRVSQEIKPFANLIAFGFADFLEKSLGADLWQFMDLTKAELAKRCETMEQRLSAIGRHSAPIDEWVNNRIRNTVGAYVDNWFDKYKRYRALKDYELENVYAQLQDAAQKGFMDGVLAVMRDSEVVLEQASEALQSHLSWLPADFEPSLPLVQRMIGDVFLGILDMGEKLTAEFASPKFCKQIEEEIYESTSNACHQQVELVEKYSWSYQSRRGDYHLSVIKFGPEANLCFSIIMRTKEPQWRGKIKELAESEGVKPWKVYALKQRLGL